MAQYVDFRARPIPEVAPKHRSPLKRGFIIFLTIVLVTTSAFTAYAMLRDVPKAQAAVPQIALAPPQEVPLSWPTSGQAAIGSVEDGVLASSSKSEQQQPIASMAKIVTALAVMEKQPFKKGESGQTYTLSAKDVGYYSDYLSKQGSVVIVRDGETITQYQALQGILIASANNLSTSLVERVFGSTDAYVTYANKMVGELGLTHTKIADPSGFLVETVSTPSDMIVLGQLALKNEVIADIVSQSDAILPVVGLVKNTNQLLLDSSVVGIKTGTTDEAGACLLFAATQEISKGHTTTVIGVVMDQADHAAVFAASKKLLDSAKKGFGESTIVPTGAVVAHYTTPWGSTSGVVVKEPLIYYGWKGKPIQPEYKINEVSAPQSAGAEVGQAQLSSGGSVSLILQNDIAEPSIAWRLRNALPF